MIRFEYRRLGDFTYHVGLEPEVIRGILTRWIIPEMQVDHQVYPDQPWTVQWLQQIPALFFELVAIPLTDIHLRPDLMTYESAGCRLNLCGLSGRVGS
jgi:hypothetical protein